MVVVAPRRSLERLAEGLAAVARSVDAGVGDVDEVRVLRIDDDFAEVPTAPPDSSVAGDLRKRRSRIIRSEEPALLRIDDGVDAAAVRRRDRDADAAEAVGRQAGGKLRPVGAAIGRLIEAATRPVRRRIDAPRRTPRVPERRVDRLRRRRVEVEIDRADVVALEQHLLPRRPAVAGAVDAAIRVGAVDMAKRRDEDDVGVLWIDEDAADLARVVETEMGPGLSCVGRLVHAVAVRNLRPHVGLAGADVDDVRVGRRNADRTDRRDWLRVEDRVPRPSGVRRLPDAAADRTEVERVRLSRNAADAVDPAAAERPDAAPPQAAVDGRNPRVPAARAAGAVRRQRRVR